MGGDTKVKEGKLFRVTRSSEASFSGGKGC